MRLFFKALGHPPVSFLVERPKRIRDYISDDDAIPLLISQVRGAIVVGKKVPRFALVWYGSNAGLNPLRRSLQDLDRMRYAILWRY